MLGIQRSTNKTSPFACSTSALRSVRAFSPLDWYLYRPFNTYIPWAAPVAFVFRLAFVMMGLVARWLSKDRKCANWKLAAMAGISYVTVTLGGKIKATQEAMVLVKDGHGWKRYGRRESEPENIFVGSIYVWKDTCLTIRSCSRSHNLQPLHVDPGDVKTDHSEVLLQQRSRPCYATSYLSDINRSTCSFQ